MPLIAIMQTSISSVLLYTLTLTPYIYYFLNSLRN